MEPINLISNAISIQTAQLIVDQVQVKVEYLFHHNDDPTDKLQEVTVLGYEVLTDQIVPKCNAYYASDEFFGKVREACVLDGIHSVTSNQKNINSLNVE